MTLRAMVAWSTCVESKIGEMMATKKKSAETTGFEPGAKLSRLDRPTPWEGDGGESVECGTIMRVGRVTMTGGKFGESTKSRVLFRRLDGSEVLRDLPGSYAESLALYTGSGIRITAAGKGKKREYEYVLDARAKKLSALPEIPETTVDFSTMRSARTAAARATLKPRAPKRAGKG